MTKEKHWYLPGEAFGQVKAESMLYSFYGGIDAGDVGAMVVDQLLNALPHREIARFALENVLDYRARRPRLILENWHLTDMQFPVCSLLEVTDYSGKVFLLLHGVEPDINWKHFAEAIVEVAKICGVKQAIDVMGVAANIPHTRSPFLNHTAPEGVELPAQSQAPGNFVFTATFGQYLQILLSEEGVASRGLLVGVPYYLADTQFPPGGVVALEFLSKQFGLDLPLGDLAAAATHMQAELDRQIGDNEEIAQMIGALEQHYDKSLPTKWGSRPNGGIGVALPIADGERIAERLERFLRDVESGRGGFEFKDLERAEEEPVSESANTYRIPPVAPVLPVSTRVDKEEYNSAPAVSELEKTTPESKSTQEGAKPSGSETTHSVDGVARGSQPEIWPPIFQQMFAEQNPYEIWDGPNRHSEADTAQLPQVQQLPSESRVSKTQMPKKYPPRRQERKRSRTENTNSKYPWRDL